MGMLSEDALDHATPSDNMVPVPGGPDGFLVQLVLRRDDDADKPGPTRPPKVAPLALARSEQAIGGPAAVYVFRACRLDGCVHLVAEPEVADEGEPPVAVPAVGGHEIHLDPDLTPMRGVCWECLVCFLTLPRRAGVRTSPDAAPRFFADAGFEVEPSRRGVEDPPVYWLFFCDDGRVHAICEDEFLISGSVPADGEPVTYRAACGYEVTPASNDEGEPLEGCESCPAALPAGAQLVPLHETLIAGGWGAVSAGEVVTT